MKTDSRPVGMSTTSVRQKLHTPNPNSTISSVALNRHTSWANRFRKVTVYRTVFFIAQKKNHAP
jgi:hypothetical protein